MKQQLLLAIGSTLVGAIFIGLLMLATTNASWGDIFTFSPLVGMFCAAVFWVGLFR